MVDEQKLNKLLDKIIDIVKDKNLDSSKKLEELNHICNEYDKDIFKIEGC